MCEACEALGDAWRILVAAARRRAWSWRARPDADGDEWLLGAHERAVWRMETRRVARVALQLVAPLLLAAAALVDTTPPPRRAKRPSSLSLSLSLDETTRHGDRVTLKRQSASP